jgi:putative RecB family exonuclease
MAIYSHSKLQTFEQCKLKYKLKYIEKIKPPIKGTIEAHLGSSVHNSLEWLYQEVMKNKIPALQDLLEKYLENWKNEFSEELLIVKKELKKEDYFNKGIKFLTDYYFKHKPFKDGTLETEKKIFLKIKETNHFLIGYIDRLVYNKELDRYEIHDYKTANTLPNQEYFEKDRQLALYSIPIKEIYQKDVILTWHYLNHNTQIYSKRTESQLKNLLGEIKELIKKIESTKEFPPEKSVLCDWCEYKSICPAWGNKLPEKQTKLEKNAQENKNNPESISKEFPVTSKYIN